MSNATHTHPAATLTVADLELEVVRRGSGEPLVLLHGFQTIDGDAPILDHLARDADVIAPSHPGFGRSPRPDDFRTVYDLVQLYVELLDSLACEQVSLMGISFGGWLAAEVALKARRRVRRLVLVDALGIKVSDRETADILDVFNTHPNEVVRRSWHDAQKWAPNYDDMSDEALVIRARNWEALCRYGWHPYMYNPQLKRWLGCMQPPTLVLWGESDGIVAPAYGEAYARLIPGARFELIAAAGHHPEIEQPAALAERAIAFLQR
jgi:pimeloyl-ACP methyl ester carboxylesterase